MPKPNRKQKVVKAWARIYDDEMRIAAEDGYNKDARLDIFRTRRAAKEDLDGSIWKLGIIVPIIIHFPTPRK